MSAKSMKPSPEEMRVLTDTLYGGNPITKAQLMALAVYGGEFHLMRQVAMCAVGMIPSSDDTAERDRLRGVIDRVRDIAERNSTIIFIDGYDQEGKTRENRVRVALAKQIMAALAAPEAAATGAEAS